MSSPLGEADRAMRSVSPILHAPGAQKEPPGSFSYFLRLTVVRHAPPRDPADDRFAGPFVRRISGKRVALAQSQRLSIRRGLAQPRAERRPAQRRVRACPLGRVIDAH